MKDVKDFRKRGLSVLTAAFIAASCYTMSTPVNVYATSNSFEQIVSEQNNTTLYYRYTVIQDDNASKISAKLVNKFIKNGEVSEYEKKIFRKKPNSKCKYWPVVVLKNLNKNGKFRIRPGDKIKLPGSFEELKKEYVRIMKANNNRDSAFVKYCKNNPVYSNKEYKNKKIHINLEDAITRIKGIFDELEPGNEICVDPDLAKKYLEYISNEESVVFVLDEEAPALSEEDEWQFYEDPHYYHEVEPAKKKELTY